MPVSMVRDSAVVSAAIRDSLTTSSTSDANNIESQLNASVKRVLLTSVEYEETTNYSTVSDTYKLKYIVLKPTNNTNGVKPGQIENTPNQSSNGTSKDLQLPAPKRILFPRENVQVGWKNSGQRWQVGAGMTNVGNTCYLNSTLQAIFHVPAVANWLMSDLAHREKCEDNKNGQGGCIICAMANTLIQSQNNQGAIKPYLVYSKLRLVCKHLIPGRQEDAHEFLRYLVDAMEKSYLSRIKNSKDLDQYSKETTPLNQILGGYLRSEVKCLACNHVSTTFQHFEDLLLDIRKSNSIDEALGLYFARERLEEMGYKCEACKKRVAATKQFSLERAPIALCIQLKRFSDFGGKSNKHVDIKPRLDMSAYSQTKQSNVKLTYKLVAMVTHLGASQHCGHYTAIGYTDAGYYHFDDSSVRSISQQSVFNTNAYIIFYELEELGVQSNGTKQTSTATSASIATPNKGISMNGAVNNSSNNSNSTNNSTPSRILNNNNHNNHSNSPSKLENKQSFIGPVLPLTPEKDKKVTLNGFNHTNGGGSTTIAPTLSTPSPSKVSSQSNGGVLNIMSKNKIAGNASNKFFKDDNKPMNIPSPNKIPTILNGKSTETKLNGSSAMKLNANSQHFDKKHVLPSMPKLSSELIDSGSSSTVPTTPTPTTPTPSINKQKSLVPYEFDDSDDGSSSSLSPASSNNDKSPPVIKTKAGLWQVSDNSDNPLTSLSNNNNNSLNNKTSNNTNSASNNNNSNHSSNSNNNNNNSNKSETVSQLLKQSHRGYGGNVISWNGQKSNMEKEISDDKREERKRQWDDEDETEMDRGRVKKIKVHFNAPKQEVSNGGHYNAFQEYQNQLPNMNRNKWNNNNNHKYFNNNYHRNNNYNNNTSNNHRNHNNNFRGRHRGQSFHNKPHHHHNGGGYYNR